MMVTAIGVIGLGCADVAHVQTHGDILHPVFRRVIVLVGLLRHLQSLLAAHDIKHGGFPVVAHDGLAQRRRRATPRSCLGCRHISQRGGRRYRSAGVDSYELRRLGITVGAVYTAKCRIVAKIRSKVAKWRDEETE